MLRASLLFFILALVAYVMGATGVAGVSMDIARTLLGFFLFLAVLGLVAGLLIGRRLLGSPKV